ncbi:secretogranin-2a [Gouania willdenowi]|uniref:Secretogranin II n=1 Tax=Gouania willdenowi TaxID=441366 RepID=A0A8C5EFH9_GOUWI|nr:secretogranin-2 [Gouania willdenowi]
MSSILRISTSGKPLLACFAIFLLLSCTGVHGASLRAHRLRGSDSDAQRGNIYNSPNADMLKALKYIESLHQRTGLDSDHSRVGDAGTPPVTLRLTSDSMHGEDEEQEEGGEEKSEDLLQAVLSALQQTEQPSKMAPKSAAKEEQDKHSIKPHKKLPLMFEDEEGEGEGDEEDEKAPERNPFKRTNENVEEKYTPQNLATFQSIFDELDKLTSAKTLQRRQEEDEDEEEENDMFDVRNVAYDDVNEDVTDWDEEDENEESDDKQEVNRGLDYMDDNGKEADEEDEEEEDERYSVKRSKDPDDMANLVDYYLLKVLEKTEAEEQKRQVEEEEQEMKRTERRVNPGVIRQLFHISQKYQIRPEDLIEMLRNEDKMRQSKLRKSQQFIPRAGNKLWQSSSKKVQTFPEVEYYNRRLPYVQKTSDELRREKILQILGLGGTNEAAAPVRKHRLFTSSPSRLLRTHITGRLGKSTPTQSRLPSTLRNDYDDNADQDELKAYVAAQMLAKYPKPAYSSYRVSQKRDEVGQSMASSLEKAMEEYLEEMDSDQSLSEKRQTEDEERDDDDTQVEGFENETVMKLLSYLNPETDESETKTNE